MTVQEKLDGLNDCGINDIHHAIFFKDGKLQVQLQVGHPREDESISGCFPTHLVEAVIKLHQHYNSIIPSRETSLAITKLQKALHWLEHRAMDRQNRGVLQTDKE